MVSHPWRAEAQRVAWVALARARMVRGDSSERLAGSLLILISERTPAAWRGGLRLP
jgi:hypothetical protein